MKKIKELNLFLFMTFILSGCDMGPHYEPPAVDMPCEWNSPVSDDMLLSPSEEDVYWWEALNDPMLNSLIERASCKNIDLHIAATRILEARLEEKGGEAALYPHLDASATYGHVQYNQKTLQQIVGNNDHHGSNSKNLNIFEFGFDAEWEIDLFGMRKHDIAALKAKIEASKEEFCQLWVTLSAEIARNYIELRSLQLQIRIIEKNIHSQAESLLLSESLAQAGFAGDIDQKQAQSQLSVLHSQRPSIELAIRQVIHRLSILLGNPPGELYAELCEPAEFPSLPCQKPIGIPSELLRRRPDIRKAERELAAATELIGSAVAALFPRLSLTGFVGELGTAQSKGLAWFAGPQLLAPVFNSKLLKQDVKLNKIKAQQAFLNYQKTILEALEETENAISALHHELEKNHHLKLALIASQEAHEWTYQLYERGLRSYQDVIKLNQALLASEEAYAASQKALLYHYIALYKALGGAWKCNAEESNCAEEVNDENFP